MLSRRVLLLVVLLSCACERRIVPSTGEHVVPWRYLVDEVEGDTADRHPFATLGDVTHYVMAEVFALELKGQIVSRDGSARLVIQCPTEFAGRRVALRLADVIVAAHPAVAAALAASSATSCPPEAGASVSLPLGAVPESTGEVTVPLIGTIEPAARIETHWLRFPAGSVLDVAFGMANPAGAATLPPARFELRAVGRDGASVVLLHKAVDVEHVAGRRQWLTERIALGPDVARLGPDVRFVFETSVGEHDRPAFPVWGDPTIFVPGPPPAVERRNVVLISLDTLRADRLGCYGSANGNTPVLDRLAGDGTLFEVAMAAAPWTTPSHATLLTGFHGCVHRLGLSDHQELPAGISPLPEVLRRAGYTTAAFTEGGYIRPAGFQRGFGLFSASNESLAARPWGDVDQTVDDARAWLSHGAREPFLLFVHTYQVHAPYNAPPPYRDLLRPDDGGDLACRTLETSARDDLARYDEEVRYTDSVMGRLFATLDGLGLTSRTIVVLVADHGEAFGEHGLFHHVLSLDEEVVRVPFIWFAPGLVAAGRRIPNVVGLIDVTPTLLDLLGVTPPPFIEGLSLAPFLRSLDPPIPQARQRFVFAERMFGDTPYPVIARGPWWRAVFGPTGINDVQIVADGLGSSAPPATAAFGVATAAYGLYQDHCRDIPKLLPPERPRSAPPPDPDYEKKLRALGYVE